MAGQHDVGAGSQQLLLDGLVVGDKGIVHIVLFLVEVGYQTVVHHHQHLVTVMARPADAAAGLGHVLFADAAGVAVQTYHDEALKRLLPVGESCKTFLRHTAVVEIAHAFVQLLVALFVEYLGGGARGSVVDAGEAGAEVVVAGYHQGGDAGGLPALELRRYILMAQHLTVLRQVAGNEHQVGLLGQYLL